MRREPAGNPYNRQAYPFTGYGGLPLESISRVSLDSLSGINVVCRGVVDRPWLVSGALGTLGALVYLVYLVGTEGASLNTDARNSLTVFTVAAVAASL